ncbi:MAG TPA: hypothetical protein PK447_03930 [Ignavibacteria bacterium]|nr:hypothetical protein [Ignavibacteria bacterium]
MRYIKILPLIALTLLLFSCKKDSNPLNPDIPNEIFSRAGMVDSIGITTIGYTSKDVSFFTSGYDFSDLDSITVKFTYSKQGSAAVPVQIICPRGVGAYDVLYAVTDSNVLVHTSTITKRMLSPKRIATLGYSIRAEKDYSDEYGFVSLYDVSITRK